MSDFGIGSAFRCIPDAEFGSNYRIVPECQKEGGVLSERRSADKDRMIERIIYDELARLAASTGGAYSSIKKDDLDSWVLDHYRTSKSVSPEGWSSRNRVTYRVEMQKRCDKDFISWPGRRLVAEATLSIDRRLRLVVDSVSFQGSDKKWEHFCLRFKY